MQIMTILGSPRRQGNTAKVLGWVEEQYRVSSFSVALAMRSRSGCMIRFMSA